MESNPVRTRKPLLILLSAVVVGLFLLAWSQASLNLWAIDPTSATETILLLVLSALIFLAFVIFTLILLRILVKLYVERRRGILGSRFKTKLLVAALGLSLIPVCFLFAFAHGLLNRSIDKWFGIPFDVVRRDAGEIVEQLDDSARQRALYGAGRLSEDEGLARALERRDGKEVARILDRHVKDQHLVAALAFDAHGRLVARAGQARPATEELALLLQGLDLRRQPDSVVALPDHDASQEFFPAARHVPGPRGETFGTAVSVATIPPTLRRDADEIQREAMKYDALSRERAAVKRTYISLLGLLTLLILFVNTWLALFLSKQITVPIQSLVEATHQVSEGNLGFQVTAPAGDELGSLIQSFNAMTRQLDENRRAIDRGAQELQLANRELEKRGNTMAAILENIPAGVISFDAQHQITNVNSTAERLIGRPGVKSARTLTDVFSPDDAREIARLFRRAARQGVVTRQMDLEVANRRASVALTLSTIRTGQGVVGSLLVLDDLTDLLRAQKTAAWQEVAQRIAHEIKNPLTPIQLSAERIRRLSERKTELPSELLSTVAESASLIDREAATLKALVDEFSEFARFPASRPVASNLSAIVENALNVFDGRLDGIAIHRDLAANLPAVLADPEQMKRVAVNLIDNAAEAIERATLREIWVRTQLDAERDVVELVVADSGPGIPAEAKERLFLPYFSTKRQGTGLGLAIVSRIVTEHGGWIRVEENRPVGTQFVIELPVDHSANPER